jgi:NTE family protein
MFDGAFDGALVVHRGIAMRLSRSVRLRHADGARGRSFRSGTPAMIPGSRRPAARIVASSAALAAALLAGCSTLQPARNPPLSAGAERSAQYRAENMARGEGNSDTLLLSLTFSGGGMRSAAASYHLLDALRAQTVRVDGRDTTLLREVDFISAISGGSFTATYYALHGEGMFEDFPQRALRRDLQALTLRGVLRPRSLAALSSPYYGRGDYLADRLDDALFEGRTFADMPRRRPFIRIGATDMIEGRRVEFTQEGFDLFCSALDPVPVARAVAASAAVPGVFSPINVADYSDTGQCPDTGTPLRYRHLIDGGVADNLGIAGPLQAIGRFNGLINTLRRFGYRGIRTYAIVVLNVESNPTDPRDGQPRVPGLWRTIGAAINGNMRLDSQELTATLRERALAWKRQIAADPEAVRSGVFATATPRVFVIEIGFDQVTDPALRARLQSIPTALRISPEDEALLADFVRDALRDSPDYRALLQALAEDDAAFASGPAVSPPRAADDDDRDAAREAYDAVDAPLPAVPPAPPAERRERP